MAGTGLADATAGSTAADMQHTARMAALRDVEASDEADTPLIAVVDPTGRLARWAGTLCEMLRIRMTLAADVTSLGVALEGRAPLGVLCGDFGEDTRPVAQLIRLVSCYDRALPLLLLTDDHPETLGAIDAATNIWPVHNLQRAAGTIRPDTVLAFLSRIGRPAGAARLMAI